MLHIDKLIPRGRGLARVLLARAPTLALDWAARQRTRFEATDSSGRTLQVALPAGTPLHHEDVLIATDGSLVRVIAAPQPVLQVRHCSAHGQPQDLLRAAHWLGTQGQAIAVAQDHLLMLPDGPAAAALRRQHLIVSEAQGPFDPESPGQAAAALPGHAHGTAHDHGHHGHDHGHGHDHDHDLDHDHGHGLGAEHDHGHGHGHGHGHDHDHRHGH